MDYCLGFLGALTEYGFLLGQIGVRLLLDGGVTVRYFIGFLFAVFDFNLGYASDEDVFF